MTNIQAALCQLGVIRIYSLFLPSLERFGLTAGAK